MGSGLAPLACVAGGIRERASGRTAIFPPWRSPRGIQLDSSPILSRLRHSLPKQKHSRAKSLPPAAQASGLSVPLTSDVNSGLSFSVFQMLSANANINIMVIMATTVVLCHKSNKTFPPKE